MRVDPCIAAAGAFEDVSIFPRRTSANWAAAFVWLKTLLEQRYRGYAAVAKADRERRLLRFDDNSNGTCRDTESIGAENYELALDKGHLGGQRYPTVRLTQSLYNPRGLASIKSGGAHSGFRVVARRAQWFHRRGEMPSKLRNITRLDYVYERKDGSTRASHGWWVRFQRTGPDGKRKVNGKTFFDSAYGGKAKALAAAIEWRDANEKKFPRAKNNGGTSGRRQAPIGHTLFWEYIKGRDYHFLNGSMKVAEGERPLQIRCSTRQYGRESAVVKIRWWYLEQRKILREAGTLASDETLKAYWARLKLGRRKARRLPWTA